MPLCISYLLKSFPLILLLPCASLAVPATPDDKTATITDVDLAGMLINRPGSIDPSFSHALTIVESLQRAPSCNRLATATLIDSCRTLEHRDPDGTNVALDHIKSAFAARLAICELSGAHANVPPQCSRMLPQAKDRHASLERLKCYLPGASCEHPHQQSFPAAAEYDEATREQISTCLSALESRPQWWTSYSNARQNAISICHAARTEIDKDEALEIHRSLTRASMGVSVALEQALERAARKQAEQEELADNLRRVQENNMNSLNEMHRSTRESLASFASEAEKRFSSIINAAYRSVQKATDETDVLSTKLRTASSYADKTHKSLDKTFADARQHAVSVAQAQSHAWSKQQELAAAARGSIQSLQQQEIREVAIAISQIQDDLRASSQLMALMYGRQTEHDRWLQGLDKAFEKLHVSSVILRELQESQAANQTSMMESMQGRVAETEGFVSAVNEKIKDLGTTIDEKTKMLSDWSMLGSFSDFIRTAVLLVGVCSIAVLKPRVAAGLALVVGTVYSVLSFNPIAKLKISLDNTETSRQEASIFLQQYWPAVLPLTTLLFVVIILAGLTCIVLMRRRQSRIALL